MERNRGRYTKVLGGWLIMAKTITITVEVYDWTATDQIENIIGDALANNGIDCTYDVNEGEDDWLWQT